MSRTFKSDILFISKQRQASSDSYSWSYSCGGGLSSGLANSIKMVNALLNECGFTSNTVEAIDNNCIDRLVTQYSPRIVVIEALWVVPEKFKVLIKLHPQVTWYVRLHSEIPFLANEGIAMSWLHQYAAMSPTVNVAANSPRAHQALKRLLKVPVALLPNYYTIENRYSSKQPDSTVLDVGCFGAIRPLKNQLSQAIAAIRYADRRNKHLQFHINSSRVENKGNSVLNNLRGLFGNSSHTLVEHNWYDHDDFKTMLCNTIDIGLQVSFTETYNIVAADMVDCHIPVVTSKEVPFVVHPFQVEPTCIDDIVGGMELVMMLKKFKVHHINNCLLGGTNAKARMCWYDFMYSVV